MAVPAILRSVSESWLDGFRLVVFLAAFCALGLVRSGNCLGSMSTIAASYRGNNITVCGIVANTSAQRVICWDEGACPNVYQVPLPAVSFMGLSGGNGGVCALREDGLQLFCWNTGIPDRGLKRISKDINLSQFAMGEKQVCGLINSTGIGTSDVQCWRPLNNSASPPGSGPFEAIAAGAGFLCGITKATRTVLCWGRNAEVPVPNQNLPMTHVFAGGSHACGIGFNGFVKCWGNNKSGQLDVPAHKGFAFESLALGINHSCALYRVNRTVVCWGSIQGSPNGSQFEIIVASAGFTCGVLQKNLSVLCWGAPVFGSLGKIELQNILPGRCQEASYCPCGMLPYSSSLCSGSQSICKSCENLPPSPLAPASPPQQPPAPPQRKVSKGMVAFAVVGSVGTFIGLCVILWFLYRKFCGPARQRSRRVYDSEQQTPPANSPPEPRRQPSRRVSRQRSGPSSGKSLRLLSLKRGEQRPEEFSLRDLAAATNDFSADCKIGTGSFGTVYKATLPDGREVAIKRAEIRPGARKYQDKLSAFDSELSFLSRLHHKHLVGLVGFCEEEDEEEHILVYEFMPNGSLYDHLHKTQELNPALNSWLMRIKLALDAARGIEYLHTYAVPPIIHRDIKSSNILLDGSWNARVSDFGLSLMGPNDEDSHLSLMAAGTVGYMDPEYYRMQHLTAKSDVYSFGVVLLELLTGKRAIHKDDGSGGPRNVVDYALPHIAEDDFPTILDPRLPPPRPYEIEAVTFVGYTAVDCVSLEGKDRPSMTEVVGLLEKALALCAANLSRGSSRGEQPL